MDAISDRLMEADCLLLCAPHAKNTRVSQEGYDVGWKACVWAQRYGSSLFLRDTLRRPSTVGARTQHTVSQVLNGAWSPSGGWMFLVMFGSVKRGG